MTLIFRQALFVKGQINITTDSHGASKDNGPIPMPVNIYTGEGTPNLSFFYLLVVCVFVYLSICFVLVCILDRFHFVVQYLSLPTARIIDVSHHAYSPALVFFSLCVYVCMLMYEYERVCMYTHVCKSEVDVRCLPQ